MIQNSIETRVKKIIAGLFRINQKKISRKTKFIGDLHAKSIDIIALIAALEGEFKISIPPGEVQANKTVGQAIDYIERKIREDKL
jgi:acyl carrier protein